MEQQSSPVKPLIGLIGTIVFAAIAYMALLRVDQFIKIKAVDDCGRISRYERTIEKDSAKASYPLSDVYQTCLKDKGY